MGNVKTARDPAALSPKCLYHCCTLKAQGWMDAGGVERLEEPGVVDDFKERVSRHNRTDTHINSETMTAGTRPTHVQARQKSQQGEREVGTESRP